LFIIVDDFLIPVSGVTGSGPLIYEIGAVLHMNQLWAPWHQRQHRAPMAAAGVQSQALVPIPLNEPAPGP
jgi:hypothetical protein